MQEITRIEFLEKTSKGKSLVEFYTPTCNPCKMVKNFLSTIETDTPIYTLDASNNEVISAQFNVISVPTLILFENGKEVKRHTGFITPPQIEEFLN